jgi:hypothetical protein
MEINLRIKLPQHDIDPSRDPIGYGQLERQVLDWIADGLFPEESVAILENDGFGRLRETSSNTVRFNPDTNRPRPASEATRRFR